LMLLDILLTPYTNDHVATHDVFGGNIGSSIGKLFGRLKP
jgi:hypothetical protein